MEVFYPEETSSETAKQQLDILLADCSNEQVEALVPIIKAALEVFKGDIISAIK